MSAETEPFLKWLEIREANGIDLRSARQLRIDADHSALLQRLYKGKPVYDEPPPTSYSYPWYTLMDNGEAEAFEVFEAEEEMFGKDKLGINQTIWHVLEKLGEDQWIVTYSIPDVAAIQKLKDENQWKHITPQTLSKSRWKVHSPGPYLKDPSRKAWLVTRLQQR